MPKVHYVRNLKPNSCRIADINLGPRGERDVAEVSDEMFSSAKFAPSVGLLVEEITKAEYQERINEKWHDPAEKKAQKKIVHIDSKGEERDLPVEMEIETDAVRVPIDTAGFAGAEHAMGSRPDDGGGKSLSQIREGGDNADVSAELGI